MLKRFTILLSLSALIVSSGLAMAADMKLAYVDMQKAIQSTSAGKKAKTQLEGEFNRKKKELSKLEEDIKKMQEDFKKKEMVLSDDIKAQKQQELQREMLKYRELVGQNQLALQKKERDLTLPILKKLRDIIADIGKKEGYTMVLEKSEQSVLWAQKDADITDKVVKAFESKKN